MTAPPSPQRDQAGIARLQRLRRLSYWLDEGIRVPGTRVRIGLDPILGLVPGVGDVAGAILAAAILVEAIRRGMPRFTLARMAANVALDTALGSVPLIGDGFDAAWKANLRNLALLERHIAEPATAKRADRLFVIGLGAALVGLCIALVAGGVLLAVAAFRSLVPRAR